MKVIVQRVSKASVKIDGEIKGKIEKGLLILVGIIDSDDEQVIDWVCNKLVNLRIFPDEEGKMNLSTKDVDGGILVIPNFTLYGEIRNGYRPSFSKAGKPDIAEPLFKKMVEKLNTYDIDLQTGEFGAMMDVELINWGPVTVIIEK